MAAHTHSLSRRSLLSHAAAAPAVLAVPAAAAASPVPLRGGDEELFASIAAYRAEVTRIKALLAIGHDIHDICGYSHPTSSLECPIYLHKPRSVEGALALLDMVPEFDRDEDDLLQRDPRFRGRVKVCEMPMVNIRPMLAALAGVTS